MTGHPVEERRGEEMIIISNCNTFSGHPDTGPNIEHRKLIAGTGHTVGLGRRRQVNNNNN